MLAFAPEMGASEEGYRSEFYDEYHGLERRHFWFTVRRDLIVFFIGLHRPEASSYFEVGCGTGYVMEGVREAFPKAQLCGSEMLTSGLALAGRGLPSAEFLQMDARNIPFKEHFDIVAAFDVIEHIKEDGLVLKQLYKAANRGGLLILTVPQHQWLWSEVDVYSQHERRYTAPALHAAVEAAGFRVIDSTSFVTFLLPLMLLSRVLGRGRRADADPLSEFKIPGWLNGMLTQVMRLEASCIRMGLRLPIGGSRLVVALKD
ncbi:MAG: hypothetical protein ABS76_09445 [Pelagibacterium sp. SCN 64-44]|nr:MAG: hypothetical protein ABS76_09445 [Pelagibacterium sp. SCN 64-44]